MLGAEELTVADVLGPLAMVSSLPWIIFVAWVSRRLLGLGAGRVRSLLLAGLVGWAASGALALFVVRHTESTSTSVVVGLTSSVFFTMLAVVGIEMVTRRRTRHPRTALPHPVRNVRDRIARARRYVQLVRIGARHGLRIRRGDDPRHLPAHRVRLAIEEAGGIFVKLGQMLATRADVVGPQLAGELSHLHEDVPPAPRDQVESLLIEELGRDPEEVFAEFDWTPVAAASIAQAHRARLLDGQCVIVKVQRPGVAASVAGDLAILLRITERIERRTEGSAAQGLGAIAAEFADNVLRELDFGEEARSIAEIAAALASTPEIHPPHVFAELSTSRVLVMEELIGRTVARGSPPEGWGVDREKLADVLLRATLSLVIGGERFHADPHPGNVMVLTDGRLGLLDFGSTGRLDALEQASIVDMLTAIKLNDPELLRDALLGIASVRRPIDERQLDRSLARFMARHLGRAAQPSLAMFQDLAQTFLALGISLPSTTTMLFRMLVTLEATLTAICPGYPVFAAAQDLGPDVVRERVVSASRSDQVRDEVVSLLPLLRRMPRHADRIATLLERGELRTRTSLLSSDDDVRVLTRLVDRVVLALVGAALGLMSVALLAISGGPEISGTLTLLDVFGYVGMGVSAVLLLRVVASVLGDRER